MPKIRHAVAMFVVGAFCIAFNTARYPAVRGMFVVPASPASAPSRSPAKAAGIADPHDNSYPGDPPEGKSPDGVASRYGAGSRTFSESPLASLNSTPYGDTASVASRQTDSERPGLGEPRREESFMGRPPEDSSSQPKSEEVERESYSLKPSDFKSRDEFTYPKKDTTAAEPAKTDDSAMSESREAPRDNSTGTTDGFGTPMKLASARGTMSATPWAQEDSPAIRSDLVPIRRPPRRDQAEGAGQSAEDSAADALPQAKRDPGTTGFRRLPPIDVGGDSDAFPPSSDLVQTYPVTSTAN